MGADVNSVDQNGRTPLMIASFIGDVEIVEMLLAAGANPEFINDAGESALTLAQTKEVERILRRAIVVIKFSAARKKETEGAITTQQMKIEEPPSEEVPSDIEEALKHLEPVVESPPMNLDSTQPIPIVSPEITSAEFASPIKSLDSTQPIPIVFEEVAVEEDESFVELEADHDEPPMAVEIDQFIQMELQDVQPAIVVEARSESPSLTLDPVEESLTESLDTQSSAEEIDDFIQTELQANDVQQSNYFEIRPEETSLTLDPMEELLMAPPENNSAIENDEFLEAELHANDVQPSIHFESSGEETSLTLDPMEELLMAPLGNNNAKENDEFPEAELHADENFYQAIPFDLPIESLDPTEMWLEESENREIQIEIPKEPAIPEPVIEEPAPVLTEAPPIQRELQRWEDWKQIEQAVAFAPWKVEEDRLDYEPEQEIELAQPIDEVIAPKAPEVRPEIFLNYARIKNIAIGTGIAILLIQFLLFLNWQLNSRKPVLQSKVTKAPLKESKPVISVPKTPVVKSKPKIEIQKLPVAPEKTEPKVIAAIPPTPAPISKKPTKVKYESKKQEPPPAPLTLKASAKSPANEEKITKARELNDQGSDLLRAGKVSEGISRLEQAVNAFPKGTQDANYASALLNLGRAWRMAGRPDISIRLLEKRMKINIERDEVARELIAAKRQAVESGMGIRND
jgi:tetratricopeptide (TPR) repeat protein